MRVSLRQLHDHSNSSGEYVEGESRKEQQENSGASNVPCTNLETLQLIVQVPPLVPINEYRHTLLDEQQEQRTNTKTSTYLCNSLLHIVAQISDDTDRCMNTTIGTGIHLWDARYRNIVHTAGILNGQD